MTQDISNLPSCPFRSPLTSHAIQCSGNQSIQRWLALIDLTLCIVNANKMGVRQNVSQRQQICAVTAANFQHTALLNRRGSEPVKKGFARKLSGCVNRTGWHEYGKSLCSC